MLQVLAPLVVWSLQALQTGGMPLAVTPASDDSASDAASSAADPRDEGWASRDWRLRTRSPLLEPAGSSRELRAELTQAPGTHFSGAGCEPGWIPTLGPMSTPGGHVLAQVEFDLLGQGKADLILGGGFGVAGGLITGGVVRWDGYHWHRIGDGVAPGAVRAMVIHDDGTGPALYVGGDFTSIGGQPVQRIAKWDGVDWVPLGSGIGAPGSPPTHRVHALASFDDGLGGGAALYAGGSFTTAGGQPASCIARWDGSDWSPVGDGLSSHVSALLSHDDGEGGGPALYAGGFLNASGGTSLSNIARWDGTSWHPVGGGLSGSVQALEVHDDGSGGGPALYAAGSVHDGSGGHRKVAKWDGSSWSLLPDGFTGAIHSLSSWRHASPERSGLYVGGDFFLAAGLVARSIARWDGVAWSTLGPGFTTSQAPPKCTPSSRTTLGPALARASSWVGISSDPMACGRQSSFAGTGASGAIRIPGIPTRPRFRSWTCCPMARAACTRLRTDQ